MRGIAPEALAMLKAYAWPGNVRQLENTVFRAIVLCEGDRLDIQDFPQIASLVEGYEIKIPPAPQLAPKPALPQGAAAIAGGSPLPRRAAPQWPTAWPMAFPPSPKAATSASSRRSRPT